VPGTIDRARRSGHGMAPPSSVASRL
jgi:hypothetical protein